MAVWPQAMPRFSQMSNMLFVSFGSCRRCSVQFVLVRLGVED